MITLAATVALLAACSSKGDGPEYSLQKQSIFCEGRELGHTVYGGAPSGEECWESVATVHGYVDDYEGCEEIRTALRVLPSSENAVYRCVPKG